MVLLYNQYLELNGQFYCQSSFIKKRKNIYQFHDMTVALSGNESLQQLSIKNIFHHNWRVTCIGAWFWVKSWLKIHKELGFVFKNTPLHTTKKELVFWLFKFLHDTENGSPQRSPSHHWMHLLFWRADSRGDSEDLGLHMVILVWEQRQRRPEHSSHCTCRLHTGMAV